MENSQAVKLILLKQRAEYLIGKVTELDEEPSILIEKCYEVEAEDKIKPFPLFSSQRDRRHLDYTGTQSNIIENL